MIYTKGYLLDALRGIGLPATYLSLLRYERRGIIPKTKRMIGVNNEPLPRYYTERDIEKIIDKLRVFKNR
jgi:hypothetical protein